MKKYRLRRGRQQAMFGVGAGIQAAAAITSAGIQAAATQAAARQQAEAMQQSAQQQADAIATINDNNNALQLKNAELIKAENAKLRDAQTAMQMNLQMMAGQQNENNRLASARIQVKNGGKPTLLRGSYNKPKFTITDGGGVIPLGTTQNGQDIYEIIGNDHEHYHRTKGGKYKSGVGIKFSNGKVIEGEGNQNGSQGELMVIDPSGAKFISKHTIKGFNPADAVINGMNPEQAFMYQEILKDIYNIPDDGKRTSSPVERTRSLKCGGRQKAANGWWENLNDVYKGNLIGAGISGIGNLLGSAFTSGGNHLASVGLRNAYGKAGDILATAYGNLKGIDPNIISRSDYSAPHAMAAISSNYVDTSGQLSGLERAHQTGASDIKRNTASGAARLNRLGTLQTGVNQAKNEIYNQAALRADEIRKSNAELLTKTSIANADRDAKSASDYLNARLALAQYNNDIANERITGVAQTQADTILNKAGVKASTLQNNANSWANGIANGIGGIGDAFATNAKMRAEERMALIGANYNNLLKYSKLKKDWNKLYPQLSQIFNNGLINIR